MTTVVGIHDEGRRESGKNVTTGDIEAGEKSSREGSRSMKEVRIWVLSSTLARKEKKRLGMEVK